MLEAEEHKDNNELDISRDESKATHACLSPQTFVFPHTQAAAARKTHPLSQKKSSSFFFFFHPLPLSLLFIPSHTNTQPHIPTHSHIHRVLHPTAKGPPSRGCCCCCLPVEEGHPHPPTHTRERECLFLPSCTSSSTYAACILQCPEDESIHS